MRTKHGRYKQPSAPITHRGHTVSSTRAALPPNGQTESRRLRFMTTDTAVQSPTQAILPLQEGLFDYDDNGAPRLMANRCDACERVFFPRRTFCSRCGAASLRGIYLGATGSVYGYSIVDRKPKHAVIDPPYIEAEVRMPEGVHVFTVLEGCPMSEVRIGMEVELFVGEVNGPRGVGKALAYKFCPVAPEVHGGAA
jgi:uncharacterized protein